MNRFELARATTPSQARELLAEKAGSVLKAGGIDLIDHLKEHLVEPPRVVDIKTIPGLDKITAVWRRLAAHRRPRDAREGGGAARRSGRPTPPSPAPAREAASPQVRNVATIGGNVLQRPRCWYYRLESYKCVKKGGDVCFAVAGENRYNVIFGGGPAFPAHPSNAAVPLVAYGASFVLDGPKGPRTVPAAEFFVLPAKDPTRENVLQPGEVLLEIRVPRDEGLEVGLLRGPRARGLRLAARLRGGRAEGRGRGRQGRPRRPRPGGHDPLARGARPRRPSSASPSAPRAPRRRARPRSRARSR